MYSLVLTPTDFDASHDRNTHIVGAPVVFFLSVSASTWCFFVRWFFLFFSAMGHHTGFCEKVRNFFERTAIGRPLDEIPQSYVPTKPPSVAPKVRKSYNSEFVPYKQQMTKFYHRWL